jgi:hypothetical protein
MVLDNQYLLNTIRFMLNRSIAYIFSFLLFLVWTSGASASPFHEHEHGEESPALASHKAPHACPLKNHQKGIPCPHAQSKKDGKECQIAPDCGGTPAGSIPASVNFSKNLFSVFDPSLIRVDDKTAGSIFKSPRHKFSLSFLLDHPPKSL